MAELAPLAKQRFFDANGDPLAGGKLYTYEAGTSTPKVTYVDRAGVTTNANPIILDANGECDIWITSGFYKFVLKDSDDVTQWTEDQISLPNEAALASAFYRDVVYITSSDSPYTLDEDHNGKVINVDTTSGNVTMTLPEISAVDLPLNIAIRKSVAANTVTINRTGTDTINGASSKSLVAINAGVHLIASTDSAPDDWTAIDMGTVADLGVTTGKLADGAVTSVKTTHSVRSLSSTDDAETSDDTIILSGASWTLTLYTAVGNTGRMLTLIHNGTSLSQVYTIDGNSSETIAGSATVKMHTNGQVLKIMSDGSNWLIVESMTSTAWTTTTITMDAVTTAPSKATTPEIDQFSWRRRGNIMQVIYRYKHAANTGSSAGTGGYLLSLPSGATADSNLTFATTSGDTDEASAATLPGGGEYGVAATAYYSIVPILHSTTRVKMLGQQYGATGAGFMSPSILAFNNANLGFSVDFEVPITDWLP